MQPWDSPTYGEWALFVNAISSAILVVIAFTFTRRR